MTLMILRKLKGSKYGVINRTWFQCALPCFRPTALQWIPRVHNLSRGLIKFGTRLTLIYVPALLKLTLERTFTATSTTQYCSYKGLKVELVTGNRRMMEIDCNEINSRF